MRIAPALALAVLAAPARSQTAAAPEVGQPFPLWPFTQIGKEGLHTLAQFRGKKVLLIQFASW